MTQTNEKELKIYEVSNRITGEKHYSVSDNTEEACKQAGWPQCDCFIVDVHKKYTAAGRAEITTLVKIPCQICPFQYGECKKPATEDCPVQPTAPELKEWLKQAAQAHLCDYYGEALDKNDYLKRQKWLPMDKAIEELGDHR